MVDALKITRNIAARPGKTETTSAKQTRQSSGKNSVYRSFTGVDSGMGPLLKMNNVR